MIVGGHGAWIIENREIHKRERGQGENKDKWINDIKLDNNNCKK